MELLFLELRKMMRLTASFDAGSSTTKSSPSINKKNISKNESNVSLSTIALHTSDINVSETQVSTHEAETQGNLVDISKYIKTNAKSSKQLPKLNVCDKTAGSVTDIETQNCLDNIKEMETQKDNISIRNVTAKKFMTDIHTMETQADTDNIDERISTHEKGSS